MSKLHYDYYYSKTRLFFLSYRFEYVNRRASEARSGLIHVEFYLSSGRFACVCDGLCTVKVSVYLFCVLLHKKNCKKER